MPDCVVLGLEVADREALFRVLVGRLHASGLIGDDEEPYRRLVEREAMQTTAVGRGLAIPHARSLRCAYQRLAVARLAPPLDFDAPDRMPVDLVFLVLGPHEDPAGQVRLLGKIARLMQKGEAVGALRAAPDVETIEDVVRRELGR